MLWIFSIKPLRVRNPGTQPINMIFPWPYPRNTPPCGWVPIISEDEMPKVTVDIPQHIIDDVQSHVGDGGKFVSFSDAVRTALRKMLDQLDDIDRRRGRAE
jgi:hypothetical protein